MAMGWGEHWSIFLAIWWRFGVTWSLSCHLLHINRVFRLDAMIRFRPTTSCCSVDYFLLHVKVLVYKSLMLSSCSLIHSHIWSRSYFDWCRIVVCHHIVASCTNNVRQRPLCRTICVCRAWLLLLLLLLVHIVNDYWWMFCCGTWAWLVASKHVKLTWLCVMLWLLSVDMSLVIVERGWVSHLWNLMLRYGIHWIMQTVHLCIAI